MLVELFDLLKYRIRIACKSRPRVDKLVNGPKLHFKLATVPKWDHIWATIVQHLGCYFVGRVTWREPEL